MELISDLCIVLLAGGQSRRMGRNKALISFQGHPLISRLAEEAARLTNRVVISANDSSSYEFLGLPIVPDIYQGQGPLAGLHAVMTCSDCPLLLALACDLPSVREPFLRFLVQAAPGYDAVIPVTSDGLPHPLCAVYRRSCLSSIEQSLRKGLNKMTALFENSSLRVHWLPEKSGHFCAEDLRNLNTPEDLASFTRAGPKPNI